ncbi:hypothetical protein [Krasilnikovia sp. MM14-A1259]|uniref:hypothetical protein n=1 Tax=Krasilnikovia sp. MM14-A1259 TaxID=3373539 RepID=UPI00399C78C0
MTSGHEYRAIDDTLPDKLSYWAGRKTRVYGSSGVGSVTYTDYSVRGTASDDNAMWEVLYNGTAQFDCSADNNKIHHSPSDKAGDETMFRNGTQVGSPTPISYFRDGAESYTCSANTLQITGPTYSESYART